MKIQKYQQYSILAALLLIISIPLPFWTVIMDAPSYPERNLSMRVYTDHYEGDIREWNVVGNLVGVKVPPPIPEIVFVVVPIAVYILIGLSLLAVFIPKILKLSALGPWITLVALTIWTQYSLYVFGHDLAEDRPLRYVDPFTPPVIGVKKIGSMVTYHLPHVGSLLLVISGILLYLAYRNYVKEGKNEKLVEKA